MQGNNDEIIGWQVVAPCMAAVGVAATATMIDCQPAILRDGPSSSAVTVCADSAV
jgi:hypothetical protein